MSQGGLVLMLLTLFFTAACVTPPPPSAKNNAPRCIIAPEMWAVDESKNELTGVLQSRRYSHYEGKNLEYIVLKLDEPICVVGYLKNDETFKVDGIDEIHLRVGSVDFKELVSPDKRVTVRGNLINRAKRDPGNTFTEIYFSVRGVVPAEK